MRHLSRPGRGARRFAARLPPLATLAPVMVSPAAAAAGPLAQAGGLEPSAPAVDSEVVTVLRAVRCGSSLGCREVVPILS
jgi:hypothetical protein